MSEKSLDAKIDEILNAVHKAKWYVGIGGIPDYADYWVDELYIEDEAAVKKKIHEILTC